MKQQEITKCERQEELIEYLYDEMPAAQRALFSEHLQACAPCQADLTGFERVRGELRAWDLSTVPRLELVIPRSKLEVLKELLLMFPVWSRAALMTGATAAVVLMAVGMAGLFDKANNASLLVQMPPNAAPAPKLPDVTPASVTPEIQALINAEVVKAIAQERQALRAQLAALETRNNEQGAQLQAVTRRLRELDTRQQQLLAAQQPSIRSIFSEFESSGER